MTTVAQASGDVTIQELQFSTFYIDDLLIGVDIQQVQEINRLVEITAVPHAPECVHGVINLRGEVVTILNLRTILGLESTGITRTSRNVVLGVEGEKIGLLVDRVADVVSAHSDEIDPTPANVSGVDNRFFDGICKLDGELLVILNVEEVFMTVNDGQAATQEVK